MGEKSFAIFSKSFSLLRKMLPHGILDELLVSRVQLWISCIDEFAWAFESSPNKRFGQVSERRLSLVDGGVDGFGGHDVQLPMLMLLRSGNL